MGNKHYTIVRAKKNEIPLILNLAAKEGWNPGMHDAQCFYQADPHGFFLGKIEDEIIAVGSGVKYKNEFAFFGLYIVVNAFRGQGYGIKLTKAIFEYLGNLNIGLDGVPNMQHLYEKIGFKFAHYNARYAGQLKPTVLSNQAIVNIAAIPWDVFLTFDRRYFPAEREAFLKSWVTQPEAQALGYWQHDKLLGYGVIRRCIQGFKIGPLFATSPDIANELFLNLVAFTNGEDVSLDIIENNVEAMHLVKHYGFKKTFTTARMYTKEEPNINLQSIYGLTTFEIG